MAENAYDPVFGARPVKRYVQKHIETVIAKKIIAGEITEDTDIDIDVEEDKLTVVAKK
jgi:ATP-dependent Clp protease ATP-binding subunit ClpB